MTNYIALAMFYAGSVLIAFCLGVLTADELDIATLRQLGARTPKYRRMTPPPPPKSAKAEREDLPPFIWRCPICNSYNHVRRDPLCWWCGYAYIPDEYTDDEEAVE